MKNFLSIIFLFTITAKAQWTQTNGPYGSSVRCIERVPSGIWTASGNGISESNDEGNTWHDYPTFYGEVVHDIKSTGNIIMVLRNTYSSPPPSNDTITFSRSDDGGLSWSTNIIFSANYYGTKRIIKCNNNILYPSPYEVFKSNDFGTTWDTSALPNNGHIYDFINYGKYNVVMQDTTYDVFPSYICDTALNFFPINNPYGFREIKMIDSILFAFRQDANQTVYLFKSVDFGQTFNVIRTVLNIPSYSFYVKNNELYTYEAGTYFVSYDYGTTFNIVPRPYFLNFYVSLPLINGDLLAVQIGTGNLVHYIPATDSTYNTFEGMKCASVYSLVCDNSDLYANTINGIYKSSDYGNSWDTILSSSLQYNFLVHGDTVIIEQSDLKITRDGGVNWSYALENGLVSGLAENILFQNNRLYCMSGSIHYSDDLGDNWFPVPALPNTSPCVTNFSDNGHFTFLDSTLYIAQLDGIVFKLEPGASTWDYLFCYYIDFWNRQGMTTIETVGNKLVLHDDSVMFVSDDRGVTWNQSQLNGLPFNNLTQNTWIPTSMVGSGNNIYGICGPYGIYYSSNNGDDWVIDPYYTFQFYPLSLTICNNMLFSGSNGKSVWKNSTTLSVDHLIKNKTNTYIFPIPAKDYFSIACKTNSTLKITLFNNIGKIFIDKKTIELNSQISTKGLSEGIYYIHLTDLNDSNLESLKLVIIK